MSNAQAMLKVFELCSQTLTFAVSYPQATSVSTMVAVSNAGSGIVKLFLGLYLTLWSFTKATMGGVYRALFMMSTVYPPAKNFLTNLEHTVNLVKNDPSEVKLQRLLQEYWTPATTLEGLVSSACWLFPAYCDLVSVQVLVKRACAVAAGPDLTRCPTLAGRCLHHKSRAHGHFQPTNTVQYHFTLLLVCFCASLRL